MHDPYKVYDLCILLIKRHLLSYNKPAIYTCTLYLSFGNDSLLNVPRLLRDRGGSLVLILNVRLIESIIFI